MRVGKFLADCRSITREPCWHVLRVRRLRTGTWRAQSRPGVAAAGVSGGLEPGSKPARPVALSDSSQGPGSTGPHPVVPPGLRLGVHCPQGCLMDPVPQRVPNSSKINIAACATFSGQVDGTPMRRRAAPTFASARGRPSEGGEEQSRHSLLSL